MDCIRSARGRARERSSNRWHFRTSNGDTHEAELPYLGDRNSWHPPRYPKIAGLDDFGGAVFHSARWIMDVPCGASALRSSAPARLGCRLLCGLAGDAAKLALFHTQRPMGLPAPRIPAYSGFTNEAAATSTGGEFVDVLRYRAVSEVVAQALISRLASAGGQRDLQSKSAKLSVTASWPGRSTPDHQPMCRRLIISGKF